jgi:hypothetical protein
VSILVSPHREPEPMSGRPAAALLGLITIVMLAIGILGLVMTERVPPSDMDHSGLLLGYAGGAAAIVGCCAAVITGTLVMAPWLVPEQSGSRTSSSGSRASVTGRR